MPLSLPGFTSETRFITHDGLKLAYTEVCPAEPQGTVLLLTGLAAKRQGWFHQVPVFSERYRVIVPDHRDAGESDLATESYTTADQAEDTATLLEALGVTQTYVVGISMGGFIALELARRHPELVEKLVLTSTSAGGRTHVRPTRAALLGFLLARLGNSEPGARAKRTYSRITAPGFAAAHPDEMERIAEIARFHPQSRATYGRQWRACLGHDVTSRLHLIAVPTLIIHGDKDPLVRVENGRYLASNIAGARYNEYPGVGHVPIFESYERYNREVLAFLGE